MGLQGRNILLTRPAPLSDALAARIRDLGAHPLVLPVLDIVPPVDTAALANALAQLPTADWLIFISPSAARMGLAAAGRLPATARLAAVGRGTARALAGGGNAEVLCPQDGADSEALLAQPELQQLAGQRVILFRGEGGRELLANTLNARGATVVEAVCYRRVPATVDMTPVRELLWQGRLDAVSVTSREILDALLQQIGPDGAVRLAAVPLFVPHPRIAQAARDRGMLRVLSIDSGDDALLAALQTL